jgi:hypothetical protein
MSDDAKVGDRVSWSSSGGKSVGRVRKKLTKPLEIKGHHVAASPENPELLVRSDRGGEAAHKPGSLHKLSGSPKTGGTAKSAPTKAAAKKKTAAKTPSSRGGARKSSVKRSVAKKAAAKK